MSGLNTSLGYFITVGAVCAFARILLARQRPKWTFLVELIAAFVLAACRLEIHTISEIGQWAGGLGPDVTLTMLFLTITTHGVIMHGVSGNPSVTLMGFLQQDTGVVSTVLSVTGQFAGAQLALLLAGWYWAMELTDMHTLKNMMMAECSTSLRATLVQGTITEAASALAFHLADLSLHRRSQLVRIPLLALLLTFLYYTGMSAVYESDTGGCVNFNGAFLQRNWLFAPPLKINLGSSHSTKIYVSHIAHINCPFHIMISAKRTE